MRWESFGVLAMGREERISERDNVFNLKIINWQPSVLGDHGGYVFGGYPAAQLVPPQLLEWLRRLILNKQTLWQIAYTNSVELAPAC